LVSFTAIGNILWPFGIVSGDLVCFPRFGILHQEKSGNPGPAAEESPATFKSASKTLVSYYAPGTPKKPFIHCSRLGVIVLHLKAYLYEQRFSCRSVSRDAQLGSILIWSRGVVRHGQTQKSLFV
jgi:hypothetical protein